ncbi:MAG: Snf7 family protein [Nitrososphaerota archaeon]
MFKTVIKILDMIQTGGRLSKRQFIDGLQDTINTLSLVYNMLDVKERGLKEKDEHLFNLIVRAKQTGDDTRAKMLANELSHIRRGLKSVVISRLAIEMVIEKLHSTKDIKEFAANLAPAAQVAASLHKQLSVTMPEASDKLKESLEDMTALITQSGQLSGVSHEVNAANEEAEEILIKATAMAEKATNAKFPDVPTNVQEAEEV